MTRKTVPVPVLCVLCPRSFTFFPVPVLSVLLSPFFRHHRLIREQSKHQMLKKLRHAELRYKRGEFDETRLNATLQSYLGVFSHADAYRLSETLKNRYGIVFQNSVRDDVVVHDG